MGKEEQEVVHSVAVWVILLLIVLRLIRIQEELLVAIRMILLRGVAMVVNIRYFGFNELG
jgi:hypothetical protein